MDVAQVSGKAPTSGSNYVRPLAVGVTVAIVTHNSASTIGRCLADFTYLWAPSAALLGEILVVDNASTDSTVDIVQQLMRTSDSHRIRLVQSEYNRGWGSANNEAAGHSMDSSEFLLLCNPDAFIDAENLDVLVRCLADQPRQIAVAVPYFERARGQVVAAQPHMSLLDVLLWDFGLSTVRKKVFVRRHRTTGSVVAVSGYPSGAMALIRRDAFRRLGGFDDSIFLYWDDVDFGRRLRNSDFGVVACGQALASHIQGEGSTLAASQNPAAARLRLYYRSELRYIEKWYSARVARYIARLWIRQASAVRVVRRSFRRTTAYLDVPGEVARWYLADPSSVAGTPAPEWFR